MPEIGNLLVSLQMETASFNKGLADTNKKLADFGKQFESVGSRISSVSAGLTKALGAIGVGLSLGALGNWIKGMAAAGESVANLAVALGTTEANIVNLQGVFQLTTGSLEEASSAMRRLAGNVSDAMAKAGPARENFAAIGITLQDLNQKGRDPVAMLKLLADRFVAYQDDSVKVAVFTDLIGKAFEKLVPALQKGADGITDLIARANELNPSAHAAAQAGAELDDKIDELGKTIKEVLDASFLVLVQALKDGADDARGFASQLAEMIRIAEAAYAPFKAIADVLNSINYYTSGAYRKDLDQSDTAAILAQREAQDKGIGVPGPLIDKGFIRPRPVMGMRPTVTPPPGGGGGKKKGGGGKGSEDALARAAERELKRRQRETIEGIEEESRIKDEQFRRDEQRIKNQVALEQLTRQEGFAAERQVLDAKELATIQFYERKKQAAVGDADTLRSLQAAEKLEYERFLTEKEQLAADSAIETRKKFKEVFSDITGALKSSLEGVFDSLLQGTFKLKDAIGNLLKDIGKKLASRGFDALLGIGEKSLFGGGTAGGSGLFGKLFGFQAGGSFQVGGAGALDSQLVAFRASPGEMVNVSKDGGYRGGGETIRIDLNPSEGWVSGIADQRIVTRSGQIIEVAVKQSQRTVQRNFAGMSAEAQARQL